MDTNETFVKFTSKSAVNPNEDLQLGQDLTFIVKGTVVKKEEKDTQEGTMDVVYVVKVVEVSQG